LLDEHKAALQELDSILNGKGAAKRRLMDGTDKIGVSVNDGKVELSGPLNTGSTMSENMLLEYTNGFTGKDLGWGRLDPEKLDRVLQIHGTYADLMRRTPALAQARGSNLLEHVRRSIEQAESGKAVAGALGKPGDKALLISGHDTNLSNLSGMLDLTWHLDGYQKDETPPGGALVFALWQEANTNRYFVRLTYVAQSLDQMSDATALSLAHPPESQEVSIPGCAKPACSWAEFDKIARKAIDLRFVN
jgi:4-phytase/acid phosphatase